jgi:hypothetical protein
MRLLRLRVRTLMLLVSVVALLIWGAMMGRRSYGYYRLANEYRTYERGWCQIATRRRGPAKEFTLECAAYYSKLSSKYHRAMWRPWQPVGPDPYAPGHPQATDAGARGVSLRARPG